MLYFYGIKDKFLLLTALQFDGLVGYIEHEAGNKIGKYNDVVIYRRKLIDDELVEYELDYLGKVNYDGD